MVGCVAGLENYPEQARIPDDAALWIRTLHSYCLVQDPAQRKDSIYLKDYLEQALAAEESATPVPERSAGLIFLM